MTKVLATLCFIFLSISIALAQNEEYSVYFYSGEVFIKQNGKEKAISRNDVIDKNTSFHLKVNSSLVLVNKNFVPLAITEVGEFGYKQVVEKYKNMRASNINEEYFSYLMSAMLETDSKQHNSGGVFRKPDNSNFDSDLDSDLKHFSMSNKDRFRPKLNPPSDIVIIEDEVLFSWQNVFGDNFYVKIVESIDGLKPTVISATENSVLVNFKTLLFLLG
ncbi:MAG: hypothetical protein GX879_07460 [Bacteroidales bacterium]|nr:hypothetical protein [Bacteroidales bacterium]